MNGRPAFFRVLVFGLAFGFASEALVEGSPEFVADFFENHCVECHNSDKMKGDFVIEPLIERTEIADTGNAFDWEMVLDMLNLEEMPPEKEPQPDEADLLTTVRWITQELETYHSESEVETPSSLRRLNRSEYRNTIRDLLGIEFEPNDSFPADETIEGFDNVGQALRVSATLLEKYLEAAETITSRAIVEGERPERRTIVAAGDGLECDPSLGIKRDGGIELVSGREFRSRIFSKEAADYEGNYRVRMKVAPFRGKGNKVRVNVRIGPATNGPASLKTVDVFHIDEESTLEVTARLRPGEAVHVSYPDGPQFPNNGAIKDYDGPGIFVSEIETVGPLIEHWPLAGHQRLFEPAKGDRSFKGAKAILEAFARRAYRRPVKSSDLRPLFQTYRDQTREEATFEEGIRAAIQVCLCSPKFVYLNLPPKKGDMDRLDQYGLASRLSYFLWSSTPDDALLAAAASGGLSDREELEAQVERLLEDPRAESFISNFVGQWLKMREVGSMKPDRRFFPTYDGALGASMRSETERFIAHLLDEDLSIFNVLDSDFTFLNERLASHYGIDGVSGREFRKVSLDPKYERGGVLGHASFLMITSNGTNTSPVARGVYVLDNLMGTPPPDPPPNVDPIEPDTRGSTTMREQIERHRDTPTCFECHQKIDPIGLALEGFDPVGYRRSYYKVPGSGGTTKDGLEVLTHSETAEGERIEGADDLRSYLLGRKHLFARNLAEKLLVYGTGRKPDFQDDQAALEIAAKMESGESGFRTLVHEIVQSDAFVRP